MNGAEITLLWFIVGLGHRLRWGRAGLRGYGGATVGSTPVTSDEVIGITGRRRTRGWWVGSVWGGMARASAAFGSDRIVVTYNLGCRSVGKQISKFCNKCWGINVDVGEGNQSRKAPAGVRGKGKTFHVKSAIPGPAQIEWVDMACVVA